MKQLQQRIEEHIEAISAFTATPGQGTTRLTYSPQDMQAREYIKAQMTRYGLTVREDGVGNIFGRLEGTQTDAPAVMVGSHFDSVPHGGSYDGPAGVVAGLEVAALFQANGVQPVYPLEVIAMVEEEGARFAGGLMGSRAMLGILSEQAFSELQDKDGITTIQAMEQAGLDTLLPRIRDPRTIRAFLELHIEQGPILEEKDIPIGIVEAIVGLAQLEITVQGQAGHAGTTPMDRRADALVAAAGIIAALPGIAVETGDGSVITTGKLNVWPGGANVIPDKVVFTVDLRSGREENVQTLIRRTEELAASYIREGITVSVQQQLYMKPKAMNEHIRSLLREKSEQLGIIHCPINSGAGHDAMVFADVTDVGMLFIPSRNGLSHCPEEWSDAADIARAVQIFYETIKSLTEVDDHE
ncbi:Zn-dependent hydrolase [Paenibacillus shenyangensis]|uniref:Zn-dependent hydrolase n=1 Tax=Paenibacillus sp. A9 TaxID=1284352 RepID=UPI0003632382|nr:Zn-dependent hydrolase [Paenibacillus sp. A9]